MKKIALVVLLVVLGILFVGCASVPFGSLLGPAHSLVLSDVNTNSSKVGVAESIAILGIFGKQSYPPVNEAAKNGGITKIATVEYYITPGFLFLGAKYKTIVTGE